MSLGSVFLSAKLEGNNSAYLLELFWRLNKLYDISSICNVLGNMHRRHLPSSWGMCWGRGSTSIMVLLSNGPAQWFELSPRTWRPSNLYLPCHHSPMLLIPKPNCLPKIYFLHSYEPFNCNKLSQIRKHYVTSHLRPFALLWFFKWLSLFCSQILKDALSNHPIYRGIPCSPFTAANHSLS